jgi:hypothetical protein
LKGIQIKINIERFAVPMFSIGLLSLVLGVFMMNNTPTFGAVKPPPTLAYQYVTFQYLNYATSDNALNKCGSGTEAAPGAYSEQVPLGTYSADGTGDKAYANRCTITLKVLK